MPPIYIGVVRAERLVSPADFIPAILDRVKPEYLVRQYLVNNWTDPLDFLSKIALRSGKTYDIYYHILLLCCYCYDCIVNLLG